MAPFFAYSADSLNNKTLMQHKIQEQYFPLTKKENLGIQPNHPKSSKILQGALFWEKTALLETGTFTSSNGAKLLPGKKYRP